MAFQNKVKVAAIQMDVEFGEKKHNLRQTLAFIDDAATQGASLVVLPELCLTGYMFDSRKELASLAEDVPEGEACRTWAAKAKERNVHIVAGLPERDGSRFYNTAVLIGPDGFIGKHRKLHSWDQEKLFMEPGDLGLQVFHTPVGRIGVTICYDAFFPEVLRILALLGVDIICDPTNWVLVPDIITPENPPTPYLHMAGTILNGVFMICADRVGSERGCDYLGHSCVIGPKGFVTGPASYNKEEILVAEINTSEARCKLWSGLADRMNDRRTDIYDMMLGYKR